MNEIIGLHKEKVISLSSDDHGRCFMAAAFHGETKLLNLLKESFCNSSENNIGKKWLATTTAKVSLNSQNKISKKFRDEPPFMRLLYEMIQLV